MNIRIEGEHSDLKEIHQLIYQADSTIVVNEDYKETPGMQREPVVIALITAISPMVIGAIRYWILDRKNRRDAELKKAILEIEKEKIRMAYDLQKIKIVLEQEHNKVVEIPLEEVEDLDKYLSPQQRLNN